MDWLKQTKRRLEATGGSIRNEMAKSNLLYYQDTFKDGPSYFEVQVVREPDKAFVTGCRIYEYKSDSKKTGIKRIHFPHGTDVQRGDYVVWNNRHWLITFEIEFEEIYISAIIEECQYLFRWITQEGNIYAYWGVEINKASYNPGVWTNVSAQFVGGEKACYLPTTPDVATIKRDMRFIISNSTTQPLAYKVSKINDTLFCGTTLYNFIEDEFSSEYDDPVEKIADYYRYCQQEENNGGLEILGPDEIIFTQSECYELVGYEGSVAYGLLSVDETAEKDLAVLEDKNGGCSITANGQYVSGIVVLKAFDHDICICEKRIRIRSPL